MSSGHADEAGDPVSDLADTLDALEDRPIGEHPDVLESVHRVLVTELDALAGGPRANPQP